MKIEQVKLDALIPYARNSRTHSDAQVAQIAASIKEFGFTNPVLIDETGSIIAGHGRVMAARKLAIADVPSIRLTHLTDAQKKAYVIADNKLALNAGWDDEMLAVELTDLKDMGFDLDLTGFSTDEIEALLDGDNKIGDELKGNLSDRFMIPPFSVLNAREGWWQDRKQAWLALGIKSEEGRGGGLMMQNQEGLHSIMKTGKSKATAAPGGSNMGSGYKNGQRETGLVAENGTSIFDPVLCEIAYRWFSPVGGLILDPFAGGSVRGIVASKLGRQYIGHELRSEQVEANRVQGGELCANDEHPPAWIAGDSRNIDQTCADVDADMVFSCPPYADLEVYSDDPKDLSTMKYAEFRAAYFEIIKKSCDRLKPDSFACFVVGEVRDKKGNYIDFVGDTVQAFCEAGLHYYNEAILVTAVGSLPIRAGRQFSAGRKLGKTHQNILVFVKGDGKKAASRCGEVEVDELLFDTVSVH